MEADGQIEYPITLDDKGRLIWDVTELKIHLIQELQYNQTDADRLLSSSRLSQLLTNTCKHMVYEAATQNDSEFVKAMLQSVNPKNRLWFIKNLIAGVSRFIDIARENCETFRLVIESVSREERLRLLWMDDCFRTLFHLAVKHAETFRTLLQSVGSDEILRSLELCDYIEETTLFHSAVESADKLGMILQSVSSDQRLQLLQIKDWRGKTVLYRAACMPVTEGIEMCVSNKYS